MIGLDSNVLLRLAVRDDEPQYARARELLATRVSAKEPAYINLVVLLEFAWTLRRRYKQSEAAVSAGVTKLLDSSNVVIQRREAVISALKYSREFGVNFADALIATINREDGCEETVTFDEGFAQSGLAQLITAVPSP